MAMHFGAERFLGSISDFLGTARFLCLAGFLGTARFLRLAGFLGTARFLRLSGFLGTARFLCLAGFLGTARFLCLAGFLGKTRFLRLSGFLGTARFLRLSGILVFFSALGGKLTRFFDFSRLFGYACFFLALFLSGDPVRFGLLLFCFGSLILSGCTALLLCLRLSLHDLLQHSALCQAVTLCQLGISSGFGCLAQLFRELFHIRGRRNLGSLAILTSYLFRRTESRHFLLRCFFSCCLFSGGFFS